MMRRRFSLSLGRILERLAALSAPRHRDLVRAMVSELDSITDPAERRRFAVGAIAAVLRLALSRHRELTLSALDRFAGIREPGRHAIPGVPSMPNISTRLLLRRHFVPFAVTFTLLTAILVTNFAARELPELREGGASARTLLETLLLALPFTVALTAPMAVFIAVLWVFTRLSAEGTLAAAQRERHGIRRLVTPVLAATAVISALMFVSNTQVLPRANARLSSLFAGAPVVQQTDRSMTIGELREAARTARAGAGPVATERAVALDVEIQKKFALSASCLFLALAAATIALRFPGRRKRLLLAASTTLFSVYYLALVGGEVLADRQVITPFVAMWAANALLLAVILLLSWRPGDPGVTRPAEPLAIGG